MPANPRELQADNRHAATKGQIEQTSVSMRPLCMPVAVERMDRTLFTATQEIKTCENQTYPADGNCWLLKLASEQRTHLIAARPHISCFRGTISRNVRVITTLYDTGAGKPAWHMASSWLAAASNSAAVVLHTATRHTTENCQHAAAHTLLLIHGPKPPATVKPWVPQAVKRHGMQHVHGSQQVSQR